MPGFFKSVGFLPVKQTGITPRFLFKNNYKKAIQIMVSLILRPLLNIELFGGFDQTIFCCLIFFNLSFKLLQFVPIVCFAFLLFKLQ